MRRRTAQALGGHLATVNDGAENEWVRTTFMGSVSNLWIGLTDQAVEGTWAWSSGEAVGYTNWASGQPGSYSSYDWAYMSGSGGQWYGNTGSTNTAYGLIELDGSGTGGAGAGQLGAIPVGRGRGGPDSAAGDGRQPAVG